MGVTFVHGRKAVMTIYEGEEGAANKEDWVEKEKITLSDYKTKEEMNALMVEKGFHLKTAEEIEAIKMQKQKDEAEEARKRAERKEQARLKREENKRKREEEELERQRLKAEEFEKRGLEREEVLDDIKYARESEKQMNEVKRRR